MLPYIAAPWILWVLVWSPGSHIFLKSLGCHWKPGRRPHVTWGDQCQRQGRRCLTNQRWESMHQKRGYQLISMDIISIINININYQFSIINYKFPISISLSISISIININYQYQLSISSNHIEPLVRRERASASGIHSPTGQRKLVEAHWGGHDISWYMVTRCATYGCFLN